MPETEKEKIDRRWIELLNELRVALPGAQVLLAFLLTAPFQTRFVRATAFQRDVLFAGVVLTSAGVVLLMAPSIYHRMRWNEGGKGDVVRIGHALFLWGAACLALGLFCAVLVVADFLFGAVAASIVVAFLVVLLALTWYVLPFTRARDPHVRELE